MGPRNEFVGPRNEFVRPRNEFADPRNEFVDPRNEFVDTRNEFVDPRDEILQRSRRAREYFSTSTAPNIIRMYGAKTTPARPGLNAKRFTISSSRPQTR